MKPFMFERTLSKQDIGDMYEQMFIETLEGVSAQLGLSRKQSSEIFPQYIDVKPVIINASEFVTDGRTSENVTSLRVLLDKDGVFDDINQLHHEQGTADEPSAVLIDDTARTRIAGDLLTARSHTVTTQGGTVFLLLIRPDHISNQHDFMATLAGLDKKDIPPSALDLQSMQSMHLIRHIGDRAYQAAVARLRDVAPGKLLQIWPAGDEREARRDHIDILASPQAAGINRAIRFEQLMDACSHAKGEKAAQQYVDALMFHALAHGGEMEMITGKLMDTPEIALRQLRQAFAIHQYKLEDADPDVARIAVLLGDIDVEDRQEALDMFGLPMERLLELGFDLEMANTLHKLDASFADHTDVQRYLAVLNDAKQPSTLANVNEVVPFLFHYLEAHAPKMEHHAQLRKALSRLFNVTAGSKEHEYIDTLDKVMPIGSMIDAQVYALAQHYLEVVQRLMPSAFPALAPVRGHATDERLKHLTLLMNAQRSHPSAMHS